MRTRALHSVTVILNRSLAASVIAFGILTSIGHAIVQVNPTAVTGPGPGYSPFTVSNTDLLQTGAVTGVTSSGNFNQEGAGGIPILNNGLFVINGGNPSDNSQLATTENNAFLQVAFNLSTAPQGYNFGEIDTYGGWNDNGRDAQRFTLSYSKVSAPGTFLPIGTIDFDPVAGSNPSAVKVQFIDSVGAPIATNAAFLRMDFAGGQENGYAGLGEVDVFAAVPEPSSAMLALLSGLAGLGFFRRR